MTRIQIALKDGGLAAKLRAVLLSTCSKRVECVDEPDVSDRGVIVVDASWLKAAAIPEPERVVAVAGLDPRERAWAWDRGVRTVVGGEEPFGTLVLAVMAADLRVRHYFERFGKHRAQIAAH